MVLRHRRPEVEAGGWFIGLIKKKKTVVLKLCLSVLQVTGRSTGLAYWGSTSQIWTEWEE